MKCWLIFTQDISLLVSLSNRDSDVLMLISDLGQCCPLTGNVLRRCGRGRERGGEVREGMPESRQGQKQRMTKVRRSRAGGEKDVWAWAVEAVGPYVQSSL